MGYLARSICFYSVVYSTIDRVSVQCYYVVACILCLHFGQVAVPAVSEVRKLVVLSPQTPCLFSEQLQKNWHNASISFSFSSFFFLSAKSVLPNNYTCVVSNSL